MPRRRGIAVYRIALVSLLVCCAPGTVHAQAPSETVTVDVTNRVRMKSPTRLGINIGPNAYYGDRQLVARPFAHGAFHRGRQVGFLRAVQARDNTFQDERFRNGDIATAYRTSFRDGRYVIATGIHAGQSGTIVDHDTHRGVFTISDGDPSVANGDYVWLRGPLTSHAVPDPMPGERELGIGDFRVEATADAEVTVVEADGAANGQAIRAQVSGRDAYAAIKHYSIALPSSRYRVRIRARSESGEGALGVRLTNFGIPAGQPGQRIFMDAAEPSLESSWKTFEFTGETFDDQRIRDGFSAIDVRVTGATVTALIDSVALIDDGLDTGYAFTSRLTDTLKEARCGVLRFYGIASPGSLVEDITAANASESTWSFTDGPAGFQRHTTHAVVDDWLGLCVAVDAAPWLNIGGANTPDDWYQLISYLAAPQDFDDASKRRAAHGHNAPWTDSFDTVYLELGNEWWNGIFAPFAIQEPELYGALCNTNFERVIAHPHFDTQKFQLVIGGWAVNARDWNVRLNRASKHHDRISVAPYLAHALDSPDYGALFADVEGSFKNGGSATRSGLGDTRLSVYELNTHTTGGAISAANVSRMATSFGAGVAVLDQAMASMSEWGADPINYFTYFQRSYGSGDRERVGLWGNLVLARDGTHRPRPVWQGLRLANRYVIDGDRVEIRMQGGTGWNQLENGSVPADLRLPHLKAYAFLGDGPSANVLLINRHVRDAARVRVQLPFTPSNQVVRVQLAGTTIDDNNEEYERVTLEEVTMQLPATGAGIELPPHSATALQFRAAE